MVDLSQQTANVAPVVAQEAPIGSFYAINPDTRDFGRVVIGGACGGVKANNKDKVRD